MVGIDLANCEDHVHGLVDVRNEGVFGVETEVGGEFAEGLEVRVVVQEVRVRENGSGAAGGHRVPALEALFDEVDPLD